MTTHTTTQTVPPHPPTASAPERLSLAELVARAQARSDTDPTWRTDYTTTGADRCPHGRTVASRTDNPCPPGLDGCATR